MKRPKTADEYIDLMHQAVYEVDEICSIMDEESDDFAPFRPYIKLLDTQLRKMYDDMLSGAYKFDPNGPELPFMEVVRRLGPRLPFSSLLKVIDETHRFGLDVDSK
jgi:hypothetical protein